LNAVEAAVPAGKLARAIPDDHGTHEHPEVLRWPERHPRRTFHLTPTPAPWLNAVGGFLVELTRRRPERGLSRSPVELEAAIKRVLAGTNRGPKPFVQTAKPEHIPEKVHQNRALGAIH
jgi:hypothetical protein